MKNFTKIIALIMVLMCVAIPVFATKTVVTDVPTRWDSAINTMVEYGVMQGYPDGSFKPENPIKRAELTEMFVNAVIGEVPEVSVTHFTDTLEHWAKAKIEAAYTKGMIDGYGDGTFKPDKHVTVDEAIAMMIKTLGYRFTATGAEWYTPYRETATALNLYTNITSKYDEPITRGEVAQIMCNALDCVVYLDGEETGNTFREYFAPAFEITQDTSKVSTFGQYVKHYTHCDKPDEVISNEFTNGSIIYSPVTKTNVFLVVTVDNKVFVQYPVNFTTVNIWDNGVKIDSHRYGAFERITTLFNKNHGNIKAIVVDDVVTDIIVWNEYNTQTYARLPYFAKVEGDFIPNESVVTAFGNNWYVCSNSTTTHELVWYDFPKIEEVYTDSATIIAKGISTIYKIDYADYKDYVSDTYTREDISLATSITFRYKYDGTVYDYSLAIPEYVMAARRFDMMYVHAAKVAIDEMPEKEYESEDAMKESVKDALKGFTDDSFTYKTYKNSVGYGVLLEKGRATLTTTVKGTIAESTPDSNEPIPEEVYEEG